MIANSLIFEADGEPLLVLTSGAHRVDTGKVAAGPADDCCASPVAPRPTWPELPDVALRS
jgi:hypothetical protein